MVSAALMKRGDNQYFIVNLPVWPSKMSFVFNFVLITNQVAFVVKDVVWKLGFTKHGENNC